ncbi:MAG: HlyC/CorC family transporter [Candidatus Coatesbacteria bacterium]|nr:HlyC/CorC family transporter [Candidatus Coatesbacteria bacterium]
MMLTGLLLFVLAMFFIALEAFFSGVEAAVISCDKATIHHLSKTKSKAAKRLRKMLNSPGKLVATTLLGTNLSVVCNSVIMTVFATKYLGLAAPVAVTALLGPFVFFYGELLPKMYFQHRANKLALRFSGPLRVAQIVMAPVVFVLDFVQRNMIAGSAAEVGMLDAALISRDQLATQGYDGLASLRRFGARAISRVIQFSEKRVSDIMVDISQVISVSPTTSASRAMSQALDKGLSRLLVYSGQLNNLVAVVHVSALHAAPPGETVEGCMTQLPYVAETQKCSSVLKKMQSMRVQVAAVVNEYGACVGLITLEDLIEEIFGEIRDEFDRTPWIDRHPEEGFVDLDAHIGITELRSMLEISLPSGRYDTLAGFLIERYGAIPPVGACINYGKRSFIVTDSDARRVTRVRIVSPAHERGPDEAGLTDTNHE